MSKNNNNIVMFPKWKATLEKQSMEALKEKRYQDALEKLDELLSLDANSHEILIGKLICLMELGKYEEAEELYIHLIDKHDEHYFEYIHMYSTMLFQMSKYDELIDYLEDVFYEGGIPDLLKNQLWQLYEISKKLHVDAKHEHVNQYIEKLVEAVERRDATAQWRTILKFKDTNITPQLNLFSRLLKENHIHPVVKTAIAQLLQENQIDQSIEIHKLDQKIIVNPANIKAPYQDAATNQILSFLVDVEQNNPSLFELMEKLLFHYVYVRYPLLPSDQELYPLSIALKQLGNQYLGLTVKQEDYNIEQEQEQVDVYIKHILDYETQYYAIIED
ncbi:tetratricopeptide repeat protein [Radiobacillus sp. PE A8.2]|uniref:tetratricopeptide repeat protein n=1 Tax=Radiobacillus sp. PE A8.2 TaxID=3380349 RepID=UPI0038903750